MAITDKIVIRTGEAMITGGAPGTSAEPEVIVGELDGPFGTAFAALLGDQIKGHSRVLALMDSDIQVRPATIMVSKVTLDDPRYIRLLTDIVQPAIAHGVLDSVRNGDIPKKKANELGIIIAIWLDPAIVTVENLDRHALFNIQREATARAIHKAIACEPSVDWLLENQDNLLQRYYQGLNAG